MADQTTPIADAAKALLDAWAAFKELAGDEERDAVCSVCGRHPCGQLDHTTDCPMRLLPAALAGGAPPTPAPTPELLTRAVRAALVDDAGMPGAWFPDEGNLVTKVVVDAVMALLSTQPAPPTVELIRRAEAADAERDAALDTLAALSAPPLWTGHTEVSMGDDLVNAAGDSVIHLALPVPPGTHVVVTEGGS